MRITTLDADLFVEMFNREWPKDVEKVEMPEPFPPTIGMQKLIWALKASRLRPNIFTTALEDICQEFTLEDVDGLYAKYWPPNVPRSSLRAAPLSFQVEDLIRYYSDKCDRLESKYDTMEKNSLALGEKYESERKSDMEAVNKEITRFGQRREEMVRLLRNFAGLLEICVVLMGSRKELNGQLKLIARSLTEAADHFE